MFNLIYVSGGEPFVSVQFDYKRGQGAI